MAKKITLPNDFERMIPEYHKNTIIYGEHIVRYLSAASLLKNKTVLDIASGSGYGTKILAGNAKRVYGVDVSEDSVAYAKENYAAKNIEYIVGDGERIPLKDASVDVVVSFETIEHINNYAKFMSEIKRVLKPDGLLVLSTPNDLEFAEGNHFHLHEFKEAELTKLVEQYFSNHTSYFQGTWIYTALLQRENISNEFQKRLTTLNSSPLKPANYLYFFLLCSNRKITEKIEEFGVLSEHWSARRNQEKDKLTENHIKNLQEQLDSAKDFLAKRENHIKSIEEELSLIKSSRVYKVSQKVKRKH